MIKSDVNVNTKRQVIRKQRRMKVTLALFVFSIFAFSACTKPARPTVESDFSAAIEESRRLLDSIQQYQKIPGIDAAVYLDGEIVWSEGFGFADLEHQAPVIPGKTRFRIGSVSKPIASAALGRLMDMGKMNLDTSVYVYVPYFPTKRYPVTVRQVGGHLAGIRHYRDLEFLSTEYYPTIRSGLAIFDQDSLLFESGSKYSYSSYGFNLLSAVVEGASGEDFLTFVQRQVFNPLGMTSTCADKNDSIIVRRSSFYHHDSLGNITNAPYVDNSYKWAGGGFISTTTDLIRFGEAHLEPGFLTENTLRELTTSQVLNDGDSTGYGIGWGRLKDGELTGYGHSGGSVGGITQFKIYPEEKIIIVVLSNSSNTEYGNVVDRIVRLFLDAQSETE